MRSFYCQTSTFFFPLKGLKRVARSLKSEIEAVNRSRVEENEKFQQLLEAKENEIMRLRRELEALTVGQETKPKRLSSSFSSNQMRTDVNPL